MSKFPHKPPAPSVRETIGASNARSRALQAIPKSERPMKPRDVAADVIRKLDLPEVVKQDLRKRYGLD